MTMKEIKDTLRQTGIFRRALTFEQLVEVLSVHQQKVTRAERLTDSLVAASCSRDFHARRKVCEVKRKEVEHKNFLRQHGLSLIAHLLEAQYHGPA